MDDSSRRPKKWPDKIYFSRNFEYDPLIVGTFVRRFWPWLIVLAIALAILNWWLRR